MTCGRIRIRQKQFFNLHSETFSTINYNIFLAYLQRLEKGNHSVAMILFLRSGGEVKTRVFYLESHGSWPAPFLFNIYMKPVRGVIDCHRVGTHQLQVKMEIWLRFSLDIRRLLGLVRVEQFSPKKIEWFRVQDSLIPEIVHLWFCTKSHSKDRWQLFYIAKKALSLQCVLCYFCERCTTTINTFEFIIRSWLCIIDNISVKGKLKYKNVGLPLEGL